MIKKLLAERGVILTKELSEAMIQDIKFNKIGFKKCTNLEELLTIAEIYNIVLKDVLRKEGDKE